MNEIAPAKPWWRQRWAIILAAIAAVGIAIGIIALVVASQAAEEAARIEAAEQRASEKIGLVEEAAYAELLVDAREMIEEGEARYAESEEWATPESRSTLRDEIDYLREVVDSEDSSGLLHVATGSVAFAIHEVGTEADAQKRQAAEAEAALDANYLKLAEELGQYVSPAAQNGREFCGYLDQHYSPETVLDEIWSKELGNRGLDVAGVRVYCAEYETAMNVVLDGFHDGTHVVGDDVDPGSYSTYGSVKDCYYERNDGSGNIIDNNFVSAAHNGLTITVYEGEGLVTQGCGLWVRG